MRVRSLPSKSILLLGLLVWAAVPALPVSAETFVAVRLAGSDKDDVGDVAIAPDGSILVTGWTRSRDFPTTAGAYDTSFNGGRSDAWVAKLDRTGRVIWSTFLGGPHVDLTYSIEVDAQGFVYVAGMGGEGFPTTPGALQPGFSGYDFPGYGRINAVIAKLSPDGSKLVWSTYFGTAGGIRDLALDARGLWLISGFVPEHPQAPFPTSWFRTAGRPGGNDALVAQLTTDGRSLLQAHYLGGSGYDSHSGSIATAGDALYVAFTTRSSDVPTPGFPQSRLRGESDVWVGRLASRDGTLAWGRYLGGSGPDVLTGKHGLAAGPSGELYVAGETESLDFPVLPGASQTAYAGGRSGGWAERGDRFLARFSPEGRPLAATLVGGDARDGGEGIVVGRDGAVYIAGYSYSGDHPVLLPAEQATPGGEGDGVLYALSPDLGRLLFGSYAGGRRNDGFRGSALDASGCFWAAAKTESAEWPARAPGRRAGDPDVVVVGFAAPGCQR